MKIPELFSQVALTEERVHMGIPAHDSISLLVMWLVFMRIGIADGKSSSGVPVSYQE